MFIRKKPNKSGTVSVQVIQKTKTRKQRVVKSFGSARPDDTAAMEKLMQAASSFLQEMAGPALPHMYEEEDVIDGFINSLNNAQIQVQVQNWCLVHSTTALAMVPSETACSVTSSSAACSTQAAN